MEVLPEDPTKRKITFAVLGVIVIAVGVWAFMQFTGDGTSETVEQAVAETGVAPPVPGSRARVGQPKGK